MMDISKYQGAWCEAYYVDQYADEAISVYISFGDIDPETDTHDSFGVPDINVFYYVDADEWDIMRRGQNTGADFMVIPDSIEYIKRPVDEPVS